MTEFLFCFSCCIGAQPQPRRRRIDRSMIGEPMNFVHTAHVGSGDANSGFAVGGSFQDQMKSKGGYSPGIADAALIIYSLSAIQESGKSALLTQALQNDTLGQKAVIFTKGPLPIEG